MRILFVMRNTIYVRNFESTLRMLAERGHDVHIVAAPNPYAGDLPDRLSAFSPRISFSTPPKQRRSDTHLARELRRGLDYLRYLEPEYRDAPKLRRRAEEKAPAFLTTSAGARLTEPAWRRRFYARLLHWADRAQPRDPAVDAFVRDQRPDLVLVTPLVEPGSPQSDYLRSARAIGARTGLCVYSWDNLTNKGLIHDPLDVVTVWNQSMKDEAVRLHGVAARRVVVTGSPAYDHWFEWGPRTTRAEFCQRVGLDPAQPYLLYLCSSRFIAPNEPLYVRRWIAGIRQASERLRHAGVLVRPHPQNTIAWKSVDLGDLHNVTLWPRDGANPVDSDSRSEYFDSIHHSAAVVGVNTSAQIESAIVGRGVHTLLVPEFRDTQEGTLHFHHLRNVNGGLLLVASDIVAHVGQLEAAIADPEAAAARCRRFIEAFVRPHGLGEPATPRLVAALEAVGARGPRWRDRGPWWGPLARRISRKAVAALASADDARIRALGGTPPAVDSEAAADNDEEDERPAPAPVAVPHTAPTPATSKAAKAGKLLKSTTDVSSRAFTHYLEVRERVRRFPHETTRELSSVETVLLQGLADLWDATPKAIGDLRGRSKEISGVRRSQYTGERADLLKVRFEKELQRLLDKGEPDLLIDEPAALGGFGFRGFGKVYNEDTLRFFRVTSLLQDAALLKDFRPGGRRRTVWEIGGGWGGLAFQFKTLCPDVTYLITGQAEMFLVSAVYLMTIFPRARVRFYDPAAPDDFWRDWDQVDFAFAPECIVARMRPPSLDLVLDMMTLERMTPARVEQHVEAAYRQECRYILSACPVGEPDPAFAVPVNPALDARYWLHPVSTPAGLHKRLALPLPGRDPIERTYRLGWRRLRV
jgi:hypothetical protein